MELYTHIFMLMASLLGFLYGAKHFLKKGKAMYLWMITLGVFCTMMGTLFEMILLWTKGTLPEGFYVGLLGYVGTFLFFMSANYGQMDSLADDGSKQFLKYRLIGLLAPIVLALIFSPALYFDEIMARKLSCLFVVIFILPASYFHLKHLIFPDVDYGIIRCIRGYNALALSYAVCCVLKLTVGCLDLAFISNALDVVSGLILLALLPVLGKEVKQWNL